MGGWVGGGVNLPPYPHSLHCVALTFYFRIEHWIMTISTLAGRLSPFIDACSVENECRAFHLPRRMDGRDEKATRTPYFRDSSPQNPLRNYQRRGNVASGFLIGWEKNLREPDWPRILGQAFVLAGRSEEGVPFFPFYLLALMHAA